MTVSGNMNKVQLIIGAVSSIVRTCINDTAGHRRSCTTQLTTQRACTNADVNTSMSASKSLDSEKLNDVIKGFEIMIKDRRKTSC